MARSPLGWSVEELDRPALLREREVESTDALADRIEFLEVEAARGAATPGA